MAKPFRECIHNPGAGCADAERCCECGWNPEVARRRLRALKETEAKKREPIRTNFMKITASPEALAKFLSSIQAPETQWDDLFLNTFCVTCSEENCGEGNCPHQEEKDNPLWWLSQEAKDE